MNCPECGYDDESWQHAAACKLVEAKLPPSLNVTEPENPTVSDVTKPRGGRRPIGAQAMTATERKRAQRARQKGGLA